MILETIALLCTGAFTGAALYVSLVEHPARVACGTAVAIAQFGPSDGRAAVMQATLAVVGGLAGVAAWARRHGTLGLAAALLLLAVIPFTLVLIRPTTSQLLDPALDPGAGRAVSLLGRWGRPHAVRTILGALAFVLLSTHLALSHRP
jgi:anthrone oxygenase-like protein